MDITKITDIDTLKARAYDQLALREQADNNLRLIHQRMTELKTQKPKKSK